MLELFADAATKIKTVDHAMSAVVSVPDISIAHATIKIIATALVPRDLSQSKSQNISFTENVKQHNDVF